MSSYKDIKQHKIFDALLIGSNVLLGALSISHHFLLIKKITELFRTPKL